MSTFEFTCNRKPTVGIELELALVDRESWQLVSQVGDVLAMLDEESAVSFKPELVQCCVEINTGICTTTGKQPDAGLTFSRLYSAIISWFIFWRSSPWRSRSLVISGCRAFILDMAL